MNVGAGRAHTVVMLRWGEGGLEACTESVLSRPPDTTSVWLTILIPWTMCGSLAMGGMFLLFFFYLLIFSPNLECFLDKLSS